MMFSFHFVRRGLFGFFGGYTMTCFYNDSVLQAKMQKRADAPRLGWFGSGTPTITLSQDARNTVRDYETGCGVVLALCVAAGGFGGVCGAASSFLLEGDTGAVRYNEMKKQFKGVTGY
jgi:hypothetical protein